MPEKIFINMFYLAETPTMTNIIMKIMPVVSAVD